MWLIGGNRSLLRCINPFCAVWFSTVLQTPTADPLKNRSPFWFNFLQAGMELFTNPSQFVPTFSAGAQGYPGTKQFMLYSQGSWQEIGTSEAWLRICFPFFLKAYDPCWAALRSWCDLSWHPLLCSISLDPLLLPGQEWSYSVDGLDLLQSALETGRANKKLPFPF